jgi:hypothetical protein
MAAGRAAAATFVSAAGRDKQDPAAPIQGGHICLRRKRAAAGAELGQWADFQVALGHGGAQLVGGLCEEPIDVRFGAGDSPHVIAAQLAIQDLAAQQRPCESFAGEVLKREKLVQAGAVGMRPQVSGSDLAGGRLRDPALTCRSMAMFRSVPLRRAVNSASSSARAQRAICSTDSSVAPILKASTARSESRPS